MAGALERFAPVANVANFTAQQTIAVLASLQTAGIRGTRAGRLLSNAVLQLDKNFDKLNSTLGLQVNPQLTGTFDRFILVLKSIGELNKVNRLGATQAVQELFGGIRGAQVAQALTAIGGILDKNLARTGNVDELNEAFEEVTNTVGKQVDIMKELGVAISRTLVTGITGADDFLTGLKAINSALFGTEKNFKRFFGVIKLGLAGAGLSPFEKDINNVTKILAELNQLELDDLKEQVSKTFKVESDLPKLQAQLEALNDAEIDIDIKKAMKSLIEDKLIPLLQEETKQKVKLQLEAEGGEGTESFKQAQEVSKIIAKNEEQSITDT